MGSEKRVGLDLSHVQRGPLLTQRSSFYLSREKREL